jgi:hydrophobe/amphiphile efflux-3 (HAE3) family protein
MNIKPIAKILANRPKTVLIIFTIITILIGSQVTRLYMQSDLAQYLPKDDPTIKLLTQVYEDFQIGATIVILIETDDIRDSDVLKEIDAVVSNDDIDRYPNDNGQLDGIVSIQSLASYIKEENFYRGTGEYKIPEDENLIYTFMSRLTIDKLKGTLYKNDYKLGVIVIQLADNANYEEILAKTKSSVERRGNDDTIMSVTGSIAIQRAIREETFYYLKIVIPVAVILVAIVLLIFHRSIKGLFIGFLPLMYAVALTFGTQGIIQPEMNLLSIAIVALLLGLGIDYSIYLANRYAEEHAIKDKVERVEKTLSRTGKAVFLCAFTTIIGFGSLMTSSMPPMVTFGFGCALGISFAFISAFILVPCLCIILKFEKHEENHKWKRFAHVIVDYRKRFFVLAMFFVVISLFMIPQIKTDVNYFAMAPKGIPEIDALYKYSGNLGGSTNFNALVIETESQGLTYPEVIDSMYNLEVEIRNTGASAYSIADELKEVNEMLNRSEIISKLVELSKIDKILFDKIAETGLINSDFSKTVIVVRVPAGKSISETEILVDQINQIASRANIPYGGKLSELVGQDVITVEINKQLMSSQASSLVVALLLVLACLIIGFNSTVIGFLALIPVLVVLAWEPGALVSMNIPLSVINITVASIMIGTGIDYSIQTTQRVREEIEKGSSKIDAVKTSIETSGLSIIGAATTTIVALISTFLVPISTLHQFSIIIISLISFSFLASLSIIPTILTSRFIK